MTNRKRILALALLATFVASAFPARADERFCTDSHARVLRVEMYPFLPNIERIAFTIKQLFEAGCPGLDLQIQLNQNYYSPDNTGILAADADLYEVDSIFFKDFLIHRTPKIPSQSVIDAAGSMFPFAKDISTLQGIQYGIPHWICTYFMVYSKDKPELGTIKNPTDAAHIFGNGDKGLLMDIKGSTTLGELYLSILISHYQSVAEALKRLDDVQPDDYALSVLRSFIQMEPAGFGRDGDYHQMDGFYARQLTRKRGTAFVGYSEETSYALDETAHSCVKGECMAKDGIDIANWPFADKNAPPVAWTDMYMLDSRLTDSKLRDAEAFIKFMMRGATYQALLVPPDRPPIYLLPARDDVYAALASAAPLFPQFKNIIASATAVTDENLNYKLHKLGHSLDGMLPSEH
jgi:thiamine pyridinylase